MLIPLSIFVPRTRMESQINRLKEAIEKVNIECDLLQSKELVAQDISRKLQRQLRELREDYATVQQKETEANAKKNELEKQLELAEAEIVLVSSVTLQRVYQKSFIKEFIIFNRPRMT